MTMTNRNWLLFFIGLRTEKEAETLVIPLDPIRVMKGMFLLQKRLPNAFRPTYTFQPYLYGPCSFAIYRELDELVAKGFLQKQEHPARSWARYSPLPKGRLLTDKLSKQLPPRILNQAEQIKRKVALTPFRQLLQEVYREFPEYAVNSVLR